MSYKHFFKYAFLTILLTWTVSSWAAGPQTCPDTSKPLPAGWSVFEGQITGNDTFQQAIIMSLGVMSNVGCVYNNAAGQLQLVNYGGFQPYGKLNPYWGPCKNISSAQCCMDSQANCTFIQISQQQNNTNSK